MPDGEKVHQTFSPPGGVFSYCRARRYSTVTLFARLRGLSMSQPPTGIARGDPYLILMLGTAKPSLRQDFGCAKMLVRATRRGQRGCDGLFFYSTVTLFARLRGLSMSQPPTGIARGDPYLILMLGTAKPSLRQDFGCAKMLVRATRRGQRGCDRSVFIPL